MPPAIGPEGSGAPLRFRQLCGKTSTVPDAPANRRAVDPEPTKSPHGAGCLLRATDRGPHTVSSTAGAVSAISDICRWEVEEAVRLGKRIIPVPCRALGSATPPPQLAGLDYIFFYEEPKSPGTGFGTGLARLINALNTDLDWLREHTRLLQRGSEWDGGGRPSNRLLSGGGIGAAKAWAARRPKGAPEPTALHLDFIRASESWAVEQENEARRQLAERERLLREAEA